MMKFNKGFNLKLVSLTISIALLFTSTTYPFSSSKETLRLPIGSEDDTYERITGAYKEGIEEFENQFRRTKTLEDKLELLIGHLLIDRQWVDLKDKEARRQVAGDPKARDRKTRVVWESRIRLFELLDNAPNREDVATKAMQIAEAMDLKRNLPDARGYVIATQEIINANWQEWCREMSLKELEMIAKYKRLYNRAGVPTFAKVDDRYPQSLKKHLEVLSKEPSGAVDKTVAVIFKLPSFFMDQLRSHSGLPHRGGEQLPQGYLEDLSEIPKQYKHQTSQKDWYEIFEKENKLAELELQYIDVDATLKLNRELLKQELLSQRSQGEVTEYLKLELTKDRFKKIKHHLETIKRQIPEPDQKLASDEKLIKEALGQLNSDLDKKEKELKSIFIEVLTPLKDGNVTVNRIKELFTTRETEIYDIIRQIRRIIIKATILEGNKEAFVGYQLSKYDSLITGMCDDIVQHLVEAMLSIDLAPKIADIEWGEYGVMHSYVVIEGSDGLIGIDIASGQFIPENIRHIIVALSDDYDKKLKDGIKRWFADRSLLIRKQTLLEDKFPKLRKQMISQILKSAKISSHRDKKPASGEFVNEGISAMHEDIKEWFEAHPELQGLPIISFDFHPDNSMWGEIKDKLLASSVIWVRPDIVEEGIYFWSTYNIDHTIYFKEEGLWLECPPKVVLSFDLDFFGAWLVGKGKRVPELTLEQIKAVIDNIVTELENEEIEIVGIHYALEERVTRREKDESTRIINTIRERFRQSHIGIKLPSKASRTGS